MSLCQCCLARVMDGDEHDKVRAAVVRWLLTERGHLDHSQKSDAHLLKTNDAEPQQARLDADNFLALLAHVGKEPPQDPPF